MSGEPVAAVKAGGLRERVITAVILAVVLLSIVLLLPAIVTLLLILIAFLVGAWEWSAFLRKSSRPASTTLRLAYVTLIALGLFVGWQVSATREGMGILLILACVWWVVAGLWVAFAPTRGSAAAAAVAGVFVLVPAALALARVRYWSGPGFEGSLLLIFLVLVIFAADIGAYFAGRRFGSRKLAPRVSPGKTWEGVVGGVIAAALVALGVGAVYGFALWPWLAIAVSAAALSVVGDLCESLFKRHSGLKDSGSLFPGHGGVLDRLDSLTAGIPLLVLGLLLAGLIAGPST